jgi:lipopolysaccharide export system ATP-binding protein
LPSSAAIACSGVRVVRGGKAILRGVDLEASPGEVVGVLGPSGAGKSTLFRVLVGESPPDEGRVLLGAPEVPPQAGRPPEGHTRIDVTRWPLWRRARAGVGYVPQGASVLWDLTVRQNLVAYRQIAGLPAADPHAEAQRVGLDQRLDVRAGELSGGERRRLELSRAITRSPRILVCDEPFAGVDPAGAAHLGDLLSELAKAGAAVLLADHHVAEALRVCTRAVLLLDGAIATSAPAASFPDDPLVRGRYLGTLDHGTPERSEGPG